MWQDGRRYEGEYVEDKVYEYKYVIRNKGMGNFIGLMEENIKGIGWMGSSMVRENIRARMELSGRGNGSRGRKFDGLMSDYLFFNL